jgi:hypothetical protein
MLRFIAIVTIAQGAIVAAVALYLIATKRTFLFRAIRTDALVVDVLTSQSTSADAMYATTLHPVVECTDDTGHSQRAEISLGMSNPSWSQGDTISIRYAPNDPKNARLDTFIGLWFPCLACIFISVWSFVGGLVIWLFFLPQSS